MGKLTIREIAKMAGVSPTAVSFVINNKEGVSEETRRKVHEVIEKTNFIPSLNSRRLFFKKSFNISLVIKKTSSPFADLFYFEVAKGVLEKSKEFGYNVVFTDISIRDDHTVDIPEIIKQGDTDGIIFFQDTERLVLNEIEKLNIPYVIVDAHATDHSYTSVNADCELSAYIATKHLMDNGHRDIAFIGSSYIPQYYLQVFSGYRRALEEVQVSIPSIWIQTTAMDEASAYECMGAILRQKPLPTAVFCAGDIFAIGAMRCAKEKGYRAPEDISFIGIDDILLSRYTTPALTTVKIDKGSMGVLAMDLLVRKMNGEPVESVVVESDNLIVRQSVNQVKSIG